MAASLLAITKAAAPSESGEAEPAVMVAPSSFENAGRSCARDSAVVSARMPSSCSRVRAGPLRWGTWMGAISSASTPAARAASARWWERAATASCSSRLICRSALPASVASPISLPLTGSCRPSWFSESSMGASPMTTPARSPGTRCGALVMDSWPAATMKSASPARIIRAASITAVSPERQSLLIVTVGTSQPMPAARLACRAGPWPAPAWMTWPTITAPTCSGDDARAFKCGADGVGAELAGRKRREAAAEAAEGRAGAAEDDGDVGVLVHGRSFRGDGAVQAKAEVPVMPRPMMSACMVSVPS